MTVDPLALSELRTSSLFRAVSDQRNSALNEVANLKAENAVLQAIVSSQTTKIVELESKLNSNLN